MPKYECVTGNWPRRNPHRKGKVLDLTEREARYGVISGDLKPHEPKKTASKATDAKKDD